MTLPEIPFFDVGRDGPLALLEASPATARALLTIARRHYTGIGLRIADGVSRAWLRRCTSPYCEDVAAVAQHLGTAGALTLNLSYEWCCTGLVEPDPQASGARMVRVLDWRLPGLGRHVAVARTDSPVGPYYNVTWPGAVGVLTAMAPGRFASAIHQAPMRRFGRSKASDWARNRALLWQRTSMPPSHLLRHVFETCADYTAARAALIDTPIALPAIFLLAGTKPEDCCVIERLEDHAEVHDGPGSPGNDWRLPERFGPPHARRSWEARGRQSAARVAGMTRLARRPLSGFGWLAPPVLNEDTRLAVVTNPTDGTLRALGIEAMRPATQEFHLRPRN